jgi:hypothetical protein
MQHSPYSPLLQTSLNDNFKKENSVWNQACFSLVPFTNKIFVSLQWRVVRFISKHVTYHSVPNLNFSTSNTPSSPISSHFTDYKTILLQVTVTLSAGSAPLVTVHAIPWVVTCTPSWLQNKEFTNVFFLIRTLQNSYVRLLYTQIYYRQPTIRNTPKPKFHFWLHVLYRGDAQIHTTRAKIIKLSLAALTVTHYFS